MNKIFVMFTMLLYLIIPCTHAMEGAPVECFARLQAIIDDKDILAYSEPAFDAVFSHICTLVVQQHNAQKSMAWLGSKELGEQIDRYADQLTEKINLRYSSTMGILFRQLSQRSDCELGSPLNHYENYYFLQLLDGVTSGKRRLRQNIEALNYLLGEIAAGRKARSYLDYAQFLQEAVEQQISWGPAVYQFIKGHCTIL